MRYRSIAFRTEAKSRTRRSTQTGEAGVPRARLRFSLAPQSFNADLDTAAPRVTSFPALLV